MSVVAFPLEEASTDAHCVPGLVLLPWSCSAAMTWVLQDVSQSQRLETLLEPGMRCPESPAVCYGMAPLPLGTAPRLTSGSCPPCSCTCLCF